jgi:ABC-type sulfate transport system permease component
MSEPTQVRVTTVGGALTILFANITNEDVIKTILLTIIGAAVSFIMSLLLKMLLKWWRSRKA